MPAIGLPSPNPERTTNLFLKIKITYNISFSYGLIASIITEGSYNLLLKL